MPWKENEYETVPIPITTKLTAIKRAGGMGGPCYKVDGDKSHDTIRLFKEEQTWRVANSLLQLHLLGIRGSVTPTVQWKSK